MSQNNPNRSKLFHQKVSYFWENLSHLLLKFPTYVTEKNLYFKTDVNVNHCLRGSEG